MDPRDLFTEREKAEIEEAIREVEMMTSCELRVHVDARAGTDPSARARQVFDEIHMRETLLSNSVLLYLSFEDGYFVILTDDGITKTVPTDFWTHIRDGIEESFRKNEPLDGVFYFIEEAGERLAEYFPRAKKDVDELPEGISFGPSAE